MMKTIFKFFIYLFIFMFALFLFLPKEPLYNLAEKELQKKQIIISDEIRDETIFNLDIKNADVYFEGINIANVTKTSFTSFLFYTKIKIKDIRLLDSFKTMVPTPISEVLLEHSVLDYDKIIINANGSFGVVVGFIDIFKGTMHLELDATPKMKSSYSKFLRNMRLKDGKYIYEYKF